MTTVLSLIYVIAYAVLWGLRDVNIIRNDKGYNGYSKKWHQLGFMITALILLPVFYLTPTLPFILASIMLTWQLHDSVISWKLYKKVFYLGNHGFDGWLKQVFINAVNVSIIRLAVIAICVYDYIRNL
jgi:hypothetical protein